MTRVEIDHAVTRERLLDAAGEEFADRGFRAATVRDICRRADANVAAINYHFGDKEKLYAAAVRYAHDCAKRYPIDAELPADPTPEDRLRAFVRAFLMGILEEGKPVWHAKLMAREMAEPTAVLDEIAQTGVKPRLDALAGIVRAIIGEDAPPALVFKCCRSIVGQILFYFFAKPMLVRLFPNEPIDASAIDELSEHITKFSLAGLRGMR
jgi:TetR/AcrR family transcriptional regulator, regulator of cefoperazone and chloramphenicol sensitivity